MKATKTIIDAGLKANHNKTQIVGAMMMEGYSAKEANEAAKAAGLGRAKSGFRVDFYKALENGPLDTEAFEKMLEGETNNVINSKSHYDEIRRLVNKVWQSAS